MSSVAMVDPTVHPVVEPRATACHKKFRCLAFWIIEIHRPGITVCDRHDVGDTLVLSQDLVHGLDRVEIVDSKGEMRDVVAAATCSRVAENPS
ncbi:MAG: hypothetical protein Ct9H300mP8_13260 [Gammaproteobacteria bacterium]|nr:MAG: hypothetical protein Ct9H300mP8_13260 [Gammaproteobacteria bacterium]